MPQTVPASTPVNQDPKSNRPVYETPRIKVMSEREILNTFQLTQSMAVWWVTGGC